MGAARRLEQETIELMAFLSAPERAAPDQFEVVATRLDHFGDVAAEVEAELGGDVAALRSLQERFREATDPVFLQGELVKRVRRWPEGYPGDYLTLEAIYAGARAASEGVGGHIDRYITSRTLAVAVRGRLRKLSELLCRRAAEEAGGPRRWLNLACGPARELLAVPVSPERSIVCVDQDANALRYARALVEPAGHAVRMVDANALRFAYPEYTRRRYGPFDTIYSAGLFDYLETETLVKLLGGLDGALAPGGLLVAAFKDARRYRTHDYHWLSRWHYFAQRTEEEFHDIVRRAGVGPERYTVERDDSGVILFFLARR